MPTRTASPDSRVQDFYFKPELTIDPPLSDGDIARHQGLYVKLRQFKDEDVQIDGSGQIVVVTTNVTTVDSIMDSNTETGNYAQFKSEVESIVQTVAKAGSTISGQVLVHDDDNDIWVRLRVDAGKVVVDGARQALVWPDGKQTPIPEGELGVEA